MKDLQTIGEQLLPAIAYGDAAGLPVETMHAAEIEQEFGAIDHLLPTTHNKFFDGEHEPGMWSDDTELSIAVAEALIASNGFTLDSQADCHIEAYQAARKVARRDGMVPPGWGKSTYRSVARLVGGVSPQESAEPGGSGNGVLMKMAPLAYWHAAQDTPLPERMVDYRLLARMTHGDPVAVTTAQLHGEVLGALMGEGEITPLRFAGFVARAISRVSSGAHAADLSPIRYICVRPPRTAEDILRETDAAGFYAPQTLAMAYGAFLLGNTYAERVYTAVNLGGDTDSIASIVGAMSLMADGRAELPADSAKLHNLEYVRTMSRQLAQAALAR